MDKRLEAETHWLHRGVTARRKRNMGRLHALMDLRKNRAEHIKVQGSVKLDSQVGDVSGKLVIEAENITKMFGERVIAKNFSCRVMRGDRVGLLGPNGAGKTTLLKMLTGEIEPDEGRVRLGTNLSTAYFDQRRTQLNPEATIWQTLTDGSGDTVDVRGTPRHVMGYIRDFLFEDRQAHSPVKSLSGGERNRLLLAKLLAKPSNLLILDEPTNDLDMDTLDLLEEMLAEYEGTLLVVSHDRDFLDRLVTSVIAVEGNGKLQEYAGGYSDYLIQRPPEVEAVQAKPASKPAAVPAQPKQASKLSYKDQRELDELPKKMEGLQASVLKLENQLADPELYSKNPAKFAKVTEDLETARLALAEAEERWIELEMKREELAGGK